ncbi:MAG: zinc-ribbon domain-containing protein, partial [Myxococcota bacterium]
MIVACPSCKSKFRIDETKIKPPGVRLRCAKCQTLFAVRKRVLEAPDQAPSAAAGVPAAAHAGVRQRILVAHSEPEVCGRMAELLSKEQYEVAASHDGVDALMNIQRERPAAVVLDAALPKMYGFEICEFMKRNESLRDVKVLLVAAGHVQSRYKRTPQNLYGADDVLEEGELAASLASRLSRLLSEASRPAEPGTGAMAAPPVSGDRPAESPEADAAQDEERERARRLARIIVSDIALYNPETFEKGVRSGQLANLVREDLEEGYKLFRSRIPAPIAEECDFIREALEAHAEKKRQALGVPAP